MENNKIEKVGDIAVNLLVGLDMTNPKKIVEYQILVQRCMAIKPLKSHPDIMAPKMRAIYNAKITKREAKFLIDMGYPKAAGYMVDKGKPRRTYKFIDAHYDENT